MVFSLFFIESLADVCYIACCRLPTVSCCTMVTRITWRTTPVCSLHFTWHALYV